MKVTKLKRVVLKEEFMAITKNLESALILAQMCYWSERVYDIDKFLEEECKAYAEENKLKNHGWIRKSAQQLSTDMSWALTGRTTLRYFNQLVECGFLDRRRNPEPKYKFDHSYQYRVNFCAIQKALKKAGYRLSGYIITDCFDDADKDAETVSQNDEPIGQNGESVGLSDQSSSQDGETITETILEINNKETPIVPNGDTGLLFPTEQLSTDSPRIANRSAMASRSNAIPGKTAEFQARANRLLGRRPTTNWSRNEIKAAANWLDTTEEEWKLLEGYYAHRGEKDYYCRTTMITLLNNWASEIDKARSKQAASEQEEWKPRVI